MIIIIYLILIEVYATEGLLLLGRKLQDPIIFSIYFIDLGFDLVQNNFECVT